jgi:hypothetical protein
MTGPGLICTVPLRSTDGDLCVGIIISSEAIFLTTEGTPMSGVALTPDRARKFASELISIAEQVESDA